MIRPLLWIAGIIVTGYLIILAMMYQFQDKLIYYPTSEFISDPSSIGLRFENVSFNTEDGVQLHGWFIPADSTKPTVLYFHGNAGNISGRLETIQLLHALGLNTFIFDYRGYGRSEGAPSEQGTYADARAAWNYLISVRNKEPEHVVVMGRSLGGSIAAWLAAQMNPAALVVESTFTSASDLGAELYPWLPVQQILRYKYPTLDYIQKVRAPIFMAHSRDDRIVPFHHGKELFKIARDPKVFVELQGSHGTGFLDTGSEYQEALRQFLDKYVFNKLRN